MDLIWLIGIGAVVVLIVGIVIARRMANDGVTVIDTPLGPNPPRPSGSAAPAVQLSAEVQAKVQQALARRNKIEAIKIVREASQLGLKEAKDWVEAYESRAANGLIGQPAAPTPPTPPDPLRSGDLRSAALALVNQQQKLEAIKLVRERTGWGLKESKDWVEALLIEATPAEPQRLEPPSAASLNTSELETRIRDLLAKNQKIAAVKLVREQTQLGLKEALDYVNRYE